MLFFCFVFLIDCIDNFYHGPADRDHWTLFADATLINGRNVSSDVKSSACKQFFLLEVECRVITAAMELLHIIDFNDIPEECYLPSNLNTAVQKKRFLKNFAATLVDKYILQLDKVELLLRTIGEAQNMEVVQTLGLSADGRFMCRHPGCLKTFRYDGKRRQDHEATHGITEQDAFRPINIVNHDDDASNYQLALLEFGMIIKNFYDAISEGNGERVFRSWKFMLLYLKADGNKAQSIVWKHFI